MFDFIPVESIVSGTGLFGAAVRVAYKKDKLSKLKIIMNLLTGALFGYLIYLHKPDYDAITLALSFVSGLGASDCIEHMIEMIPRVLKSVKDKIIEKLKCAFK